MYFISFSKTVISITKGTVNWNIAAELRPGVTFLSVERFFRSGVSQDRRQRRRPPGLKRMDGDYVRSGEVLLDQFYLNFHPGLNVKILEKNRLVSMREGRVMLTCEKINPIKGNYVVDKYYGNMTAPVVYKRFIHVIPFSQGQIFKLVNLV